MSRFFQPSTRLQASAGVVGLRMLPNIPSSANSADARSIEESLKMIVDQSDQISVRMGAESPRDLPATVDERLYNSLANAKVLTSQVAMHLDAEWRTRLFDQLDQLLAARDWHAEDEPVKTESFNTFLRTILFLSPARRPGLGVSNAGNLIAAWTTDDDRLTLEFVPGDTVKWALSLTDEGERERAVGVTRVPRLSEVLTPYMPSRWFDVDSLRSA